MKDKNKILYNSGISGKDWRKVLNEEHAEEYVRTEEVKNRISDSFNKLMREIMYANNDVAYSFKYGSFGREAEENLEKRKKSRKEVLDFVMEKFNKLKEVIEENLGEQHKSTTTDSTPEKEEDEHHEA